MGSMTSDQLSLCKITLCLKHLFLIGLTTAELKKKKAGEMMYVYFGVHSKMSKFRFILGLSN